MNLQFSKKLVKTKVENPVNPRNGSSFQIQDSPPYPPISMLNLVKFCCQKPKTLQTTLIWGEGGFSAKKYFFHFLSTVLCKIVGYWYFLKTTPQIAEWYWNACWCAVSFKFNQVQVIKVIFIDYFSYSASKYGIFEGYLQFFQIKQKIVFNFFKTNPNVCIGLNIIWAGTAH